MKIIKGYGQWVNENLSEDSTSAPTVHAPFEDQTATGLTFKDRATWETAQDLVFKFVSYKYDPTVLLPPKIGFGKAFLTYDGSTTPKLKPNEQIQSMLANIAQGIFHVSVFLGRKDCNWASRIAGTKMNATNAYKAFRPKSPSPSSILPGAADLMAIDLETGKRHEVPFAYPGMAIGLGLVSGEANDARWSAIFKTVKPQVDAALAYANAPAATPAKPAATAPAAPGKAASTSGTLPRQ